MGSFLYPRTIAITRPGAQSGVGFQAAYAADQKSSETLVASGVPASIQARSASSKNPVSLPADGKMNTWRVLVPRNALGAGVALNRDIITDDLSRRFQIVADYVNSLGANFICERLEA